MFDWFSKKANVTTTAVAEIEQDQKPILLAKIRELDAELSAHLSTMNSFRSIHMQFVDGRLALLYPKDGDTGAARVELESQWRGMVDRHAEILRERNSVLADLAPMMK